MVCIYCGNKTSVTNSRSQRGGQATWRRRRCQNCQAIFTTTESAELSGALMVERDNGELKPFSRDILFYSLAASCGHRQNGVADASGLTDTVIHSILRQKRAVTALNELKQAILAVLERFDVVAATYYKAYFVS